MCLKGAFQRRQDQNRVHVARKFAGPNSCSSSYHMFYFAFLKVSWMIGTCLCCTHRRIHFPTVKCINILLPKNLDVIKWKVLTKLSIDKLFAMKYPFETWYWIKCSWSRTIWIACQINEQFWRDERYFTLQFRTCLIWSSIEMKCFLKYILSQYNLKLPCVVIFLNRSIYSFVSVARTQLTKNTGTKNLTNILEVFQ